MAVDAGRPRKLRECRVSAAAARDRDRITLRKRRNAQRYKVTRECCACGLRLCGRGAWRSVRTVDEAVDHAREALGRLHEFNARSVEHDFLIDVADTAVGNPSLDDATRLFAEGERGIREGIDVQRKRRFDPRAAVAQLA